MRDIYHSMFDEEPKHYRFEERESEKNVWVWAVLIVVIVSLFIGGIIYQSSLNCQGDVTTCSI